MSYQRTRVRSTGSIPPIRLGETSMLSFPYCTYGTPTGCYTGTRDPLSYEWCEDVVNPGPPYKVGYHLFLKRQTAQFMDTDSFNVRAWFYRYDGKFGVGVGSDNELNNIFAAYEKTVGTYGAQAHKVMRPVQPRYGLGQAIGELRDIKSLPSIGNPLEMLQNFPRLLRDRIKFFKELGSSYLNYEFGWRPFLKDLLDVINFQKGLERHVKFIRKNNGKWLKRTCTLRNTLDTTTTQAGTIVPPIPSYLIWPVGSFPTCTRTLITRDRIWAVARMKFYIQGLEVDEAKDVWSSPLLRRLAGLEITPSLLWELTPWSWLADWFHNMGDIYANLSGTDYDNLVTKYAYVMRHRQSTAIYDGYGKLRNNIPICTSGRITGYLPPEIAAAFKVRAVFTVECKERERAFWWGVGNNDGSSLNERQLAILLALGIQRVI